MNLRQIKCFWAVGTLMSFSKASEELFLSQPSVSKYIASLEAELKLKLIIRDGRNIRISSDGQKLLPHCGEIIRSLQRFEDEATGLCERTTEEPITLCGIPPMVEYGIVELVSTFRSKFPYHDVSIVEKDEGDLLVQLRLDAFDIAFCSDLHIDKEQYNFHPIRQESFDAVLSKQHPLANRDSIFFRELNGCDFVFPNDGSMLYNLCYDACQTANIKPKVLMQCSSPISADVMLQRNANCCWFAIAALNNAREHPWHTAKIVDSPTFNMGFCWKKKRSSNDTLQAFIKFISTLYPTDKQ